MSKIADWLAQIRAQVEAERLIERAQMRCPQCGSRSCGPIACRFSGLQHIKAKPADPA